MNDKIIQALTDFIDSLKDKRDKYSVNIDEHRWKEVFEKDGWQTYQTTHLDKITIEPDKYYAKDTYFGYVLDILISPSTNKYTLTERYFHLDVDESEEELERHVLDYYFDDYNSGSLIEQRKGYLHEITATDFKDFIIKIKPIIDKKPNASDSYAKLLALLKGE